jgi:hypothetical protein
LEKASHTLPCLSSASTDWYAADLRICDVGKDIEGTYVFDVPSAGDHHQFRRALSFSRCLLMAEASRRGYNTLSMERYVALGPR